MNMIHRRVPPASAGLPSFTPSTIGAAVAAVLPGASRRCLVATLGATALSLGAMGVAAQESKPAPADDEPIEYSVGTVEEMVVTGTRIVRDGYSAPTPVSVISSEEITREAPANITDFVNTLPAVRGSNTPASTNGSLSNGQAGIATVNLRNLGANRTLVLLDGQRSVSSATNGSVDISTVPQALIERVEVVTGGASSAYGSDAVSGVVNFILNKTFTGLKSDYEYGITTYGDGQNQKVTLTGGTAFGGDRGHALLSGEYFSQEGIQSIDRDWNTSGFFQIENPAYSAAACADNNPGTACLPSRLIQSGIGTGTFSPGGLVLSGPLRGTYFGTVNPATGRASVNQIVYGAQNAQWMVGGDYRLASDGHTSSATLLPSEQRKSLFARTSWEFTPGLSVFAQAAYSYYRGQSFYQQTPTTPVTIRRDNAFLPASVVSSMVANNLQTVSIGTSNIGIPPQGSDMRRQVRRFVVGAGGDVEAVKRAWRWDAYYQLGITNSDELLTNTWNLSRMALATDAVVAPAGNAAGIAAGTIACRSTLTAPTNGCRPLNRIGVGGMDPAAVAYVLYDGLQPLREQKLSQDVAAISISTNELATVWAGPVSLALGIEYRKEEVEGFVDPLYQPSFVNGVTVSSWIYGNYVPTFGDYAVTEGFVETIVPIVEGLDFNGAFRLTDYSTSGKVETWKLGLTWQPAEDVKLRGTYSRDIRAPNLGELFAPGAGATNAVNVPQPNGTLLSDGYINSQVGNTALTPEIAKTLGAGVVFTPAAIPGFAASVDYYSIDLSDAIATLSAQTLVDQCYLQGITSSCSYISTSGGRGVTTLGLDVISVDIQPLNFTSIKSEGVDIEASYRAHLGPGTLALRGLATNAIKRMTDNGIDPATDSAGQNSGSLPDWSYRFSAGYNLDTGLGFQLVARGVSDGVYDNDYVVCSTDCPLSTVVNRTVNRNDIAGAWYFDVNADYRFEVAGFKTSAFLSIRNVTNEDPVLVGNGPTGNNTPAYPQTNRQLYDVLGRVFRLGVRVSL
jgi:iron complex outermembrane recepter protein